MAITLAQAEQSLLLPTRAGQYVALAGMDVSGGSPVASLADPISLALYACGVQPENPAAPSDTDLAKLDPRNWYKFLDVATFHVLDALVVYTATQAQSVSFPNYSVTKSTGLLREALESRRRQVRDQWGYGLATLGGGSVRTEGYPLFPYDGSF